MPPGWLAKPSYSEIKGVMYEKGAGWSNPKRALFSFDSLGWLLDLTEPQLLRPASREHVFRRDEVRYAITNNNGTLALHGASWRMQ